MGVGIVSGISDFGLRIPNPAAGVPIAAQVGPGTSVALQGADPKDGCGLSLSGSRAGLVLNSVLADLAVGAERTRGVEVDESSGASTPPASADVEGGSGPDGLLMWSSPRPGPAFDLVLDELAADRIRWPCGTASKSRGPAGPLAGEVTNPRVPGEPDDRYDRTGTSGGLLPRLAVTLLAAGLWGCPTGPLRRRQSSLERSRRGMHGS
jgi:hypothetical protein